MIKSYKKIYLFFISAFILAIFSSIINNNVGAISIYEQGLNKTSDTARLAAETSFQSNMSNLNQLTKVSSVNIKELKSPSPEMLLGTGETEEVIGTLAGYDNVQSYKLAKLLPSISNIITETTEYTFDPSKSISSNITLGNSTNSTVVTAEESQSFVRLNQVMDNPLDMKTGCNNRCAPPDPVAAAGPSHVFQLVNVSWKNMVQG